MSSPQRPCPRRPRIAPALRPLTTAVLLALAANAGAQVLPTGFVVDTGTVSTPVINGAGDTMDINQGSQNAIINWETFSIGDGYTVNFNQPGTTSIAINRVLGDSASNIFGNLNSNGNVFLINTNGVLFGQNAQVNVGGLVASALDLESVDFDNGVFVFSEAGGDVVNQGGIVAGSGGTVALLGNEAVNAASGSIVAPRGSVIMGSGDRITLDFEGDGLTQVTVEGQLVNGLVRNAGLLQSDGGNVTLVALADGDGDGLSIVHSGIIRARSLGNRNGRIVLDAGDGEVVVGADEDANGQLLTTGATIDATGLGSGQRGGSVEIRGRTITVAGASTVDADPCGAGDLCTVIDASGNNGGGSIVFDSAYSTDISGIRGFGTEGTAVRILSDATGSGTGGTIAINNDGTPSGGSDPGNVTLLGGVVLSAAGRGTAGGGSIRLANTAGSIVALTLPDVGDIFGSASPSFDVGGSAGGGAIGLQAGGVVVVDNGITLSADAVDNGDGGEIRLVGDNGLRAFGDLSARGGASGGNGGFIETSGGGVDLRGIGIDASAPNGDAGTWLIDPYDVDIIAGNAAGTLPANPFDPVATSVIQDGDINNALDAGTSVRITTGAVDAGESFDGDIFIGNGVDIVRSIGDAAVEFRLDANSGISGSNFRIRSATAGPLDIIFNADANGLNPFNSNIELFNAELLSNGGDVLMFGQSDPDAGAASGFTSGIILTRTTLDTRVGQSDAGAGGDVLLRGSSDFGDAGPDEAGVRLDGSTIASATGDIDIIGIGIDAGAGFATGVRLMTHEDVDLGNRDTVLSSTSGAISITGLAASGLASLQAPVIGVDLLGGSSITTGTGAISIAGRADAVAGTGVGLSDSVVIGTTSAPILLTGEATGGGAGLSLGAGTTVDAGSGPVVLRAGNDGSEDAVVIGGQVNSGSVVNLRPGGVDANGLAHDRIDDAITLGTAVGFAVSATEMGNITTPELVFGSDTHVGLIQVQEALARAGNLTLHNAGAGAAGIALGAAVDVGTGTLALVSAGDITQTAAGAITADGLLARSTGGDVLLSTATNNVSALAGDAAGEFSYTDADALTVGTVTATGFGSSTNGTLGLTATGVGAGTDVFVRNLAGDLVLDAGATAGNDIDLVTAGRLQNPAGATLSAGNTWRVWASTWIGETRGGLAGSGTLPNLYNCTFAGACGVVVPAAGNHFIYAAQPTATITIGDALREYGLDNPAFTFTVAGMILGDIAGNAITGEPGTVATILSNVGDYPIGGAFDSPAGYAINLVPGTLTIDPATLTFIANPFTRIYGDPNGVLGGTVTGFRNGEDLGSATDGTLTFTSTADEFSNVGNYAIIGGGLSAGNYVFVQDPGNATALRIDPATLTFIADPFTRLVGQPNGLFTGIVTGFRNGEDLGSATDGTLTFTSSADEFSPVGSYEIDGGGLTATNYVFVQDPGNATALTVAGPVGSVFPPDFVRDPPDNYVYNSNLGSSQMCALVDVVAGTQGREGDTLAREWSRVRSRPNLTNCVQTNQRNGCADF